MKSEASSGFAGPARHRRRRALPTSLEAAPRARSDRLEEQTQAAIVQFHAAAVPRDQAILFAVPNGEARDRITAAKLTGMSGERRALLAGFDALTPAGQGVVPGATDLVLVTGGRARLARIMALVRPEVTVAQLMAVMSDIAVIDLIEVKRPRLAAFDISLGKVRAKGGGRLDRQQKLFAELARHLGVAPIVVDSIEQYADLLELRGVALKCREFGPNVRQPRLPAPMRV